MASTGSARLNSSLRNLRQQWDRAREDWDDKVAIDFEKNHLVPLEQQAKNAMVGMDKLSEVLGQIRRTITIATE